MSLRPWEPDEASIYAGLRDDIVLRFTTESPDAGKEECRRHIVDARADPHRVPFAIRGPDGVPVGNLAVRRRGDTAELSYWLGATGRGRGWASSALRAATEWAFGAWPVRTAELEIDPANEASMRVAQAAGYRRRGTRLTSACGGPAVIYIRSADR